MVVDGESNHAPARAWSPFLRLITGGAVSIAILLLLLTIIFSSAMDRISREDGPFEWFQFIIFFLSGLIWIVAALLRPRDRGWLSSGRLFCIAMAILLLVLAMEEISWGQRLFGIGTFDSLEGLNYQDENNAHNLFLFGSRSLSYFALPIFFFGIGVALPLLREFSKRFHSLIDRFGVMVPGLLYVPVFLIGLSFTSGDVLVRYQILQVAVVGLPLLLLLNTPRSEGRISAPVRLIYTIPIAFGLIAILANVWILAEGFPNSVWELRETILAIAMLIWSLDGLHRATRGV